MPRPDDRVLVVGSGPIGLAVTAHLVVSRLRPWVADLSPQRRAFARAWTGVDVLDLGTDGPAVVREAMAGELATLVFDATGSAASMHAAFDLLAPGGRLVLVGLFQGDLSFHDPDFHRRELTVLGSRNATAADFRHSIEIIERGQAPVADWITQRTTLEELPATFRSLEEKGSGSIKAIVDL
jgi:threonine dehydrogenase-like Zn-dependent dehydrogenase